MHISFDKLVFEFINASRNTQLEVSDEKILVEKFKKLMEKFKFYLYPVHFCLAYKRKYSP